MLNPSLNFAFRSSNLKALPNQTAHAQGISHNPVHAPAPSNASPIVFGNSTTTTTPMTNAQATTILKKPPFAPTNTKLFNPPLYSTSVAMAPAAAKTVTATDIKNQLTSIFTQRFGGNTTQIQAGLAKFNDPTLTQIVPDVRLRGSLAALYGTPAEGAIDTIKSGVYGKVYFTPLDPSGIAKTVKQANATKPEIQVNSRYQYEDIRTLAATMAHEPLHQDPTNSGREERIAHSLDTLIYGQFVSEDPALASKPTELTQRSNNKLLARLNSRDTNGNLRLFTSQGNVFPGSTTTLANFGAAYTENGGPVTTSSPGNAYLNSFLRKATGVNVTNANFDANTESLIDTHQAMLSPVQLVNIAKALQLKIS